MTRLWRCLLRLFFRLLYNECASFYDLVAWLVSWGEWYTWGRVALNHIVGTRVLELAHGTGHLLVAMEHRGLHPVGLDLSAKMGHIARRRVRLAHATTPLVRARAEALPFRSGCFESVVATFPTEFISGPSTLREVARILQSADTLHPAPRLVVVAWARPTGRQPHWRALSWLYQITGQGTPPEEAIDRVLQGAQRWFNLRMEIERIGHAEVTFFVGEKR